MIKLKWYTLDPRFVLCNPKLHGTTGENLHTELKNYIQQIKKDKGHNNYNRKDNDITNNNINRDIDLTCHLEEKINISSIKYMLLAAFEKYFDGIRI